MKPLFLIVAMMMACLQANAEVKTLEIQKEDLLGTYSFSKELPNGDYIPHTKIACFATNSWTEDSKKIKCYLVKSDKSKHLLVLQEDPNKSEFDMMKE